MPELVSGVVGTAHHFWVAHVCWSWFLWVALQTGLLATKDRYQVSRASLRQVLLQQLSLIRSSECSPHSTMTAVTTAFSSPLVAPVAALTIP